MASGFSHCYSSIIGMIIYYPFLLTLIMFNPYIYIYYYYPLFLYCLPLWHWEYHGLPREIATFWNSLVLPLWSSSPCHALQIHRGAIHPLAELQRWRATSYKSKGAQNRSYKSIPLMIDGQKFIVNSSSSYIFFIYYNLLFTGDGQI